MDRSIILASASPRRKEMFEKANLPTTIIPSSYEEVLPFPMMPKEKAMFYALGKALDVRDTLRREASQPRSSQSAKDPAPVVVGADTIVVFEDRVMEKPKNKEDGMAMLMALCGNTHKVITGVCLADTESTLSRCFYEESFVTFSSYTREEMEAYLSTDEPYDKAAGYAIQGTFKKYITAVDGDVDNVIGFPLTRFLAELADFPPPLR